MAQYIIPQKALLAAVQAASRFAGKRQDGSVISGILIDTDSELPRLVACDGYRMISQPLLTLSGLYPNVEQIIPKEFAYHVRVNRLALLSALTALPGRQRDGCQVTLGWEGDASGRLVLGGHGRGEIPMTIKLEADLTGDWREDRHFNSSHFIDALKATGAPDVQLGFTKHQMGSILLQAALAEPDGLRVMIMPLRG